MKKEELFKLKEKALANLREKIDYNKVYIDDKGNFKLKGDFYENQKRLVLKNCGIIDPSSIEDYIGLDGYKALYKAIYELDQREIIDIVKDSGLRGRGGAGFPVGRKWEAAYREDSPIKYIICNADEGDPGAFMDRSVLELDPHSVLEAMAIGAFAIGANKGFIYVRAEYPKAVKALEKAIKDAKAYNLLGENILDSDFSFDIELRLGAGAFVCGEGTALMESIEGKRGMPRNKEYRTTVKGLWGKPTVINNVESLANIGQIINKGPAWFRTFGTEKSPGTKVFALSGKVKRAGLVEVAMGTSINTIVYDIGKGIQDDKEAKAVQTGGPSGGCIPKRLFDTACDFESLKAIGSIMGSGGMVVMDEDDCMVDVARFFLEFSVDESCGKCTPCRIGNKRLFEMLDDLTKGKADQESLDKLDELAHIVAETSLCGLGKSSPNPIISTMKYFYDEYEAHIGKTKTCPAKRCLSLLNYDIGEACIGCGKCKRLCQAQAISGEVRNKHEINKDKCIKCGQCKENCPIDAICLG